MLSDIEIAKKITDQDGLQPTPTNPTVVEIGIRMRQR
jgi:hypothetical protein